jgi:hypothetical protein
MARLLERGNSGLLGTEVGVLILLNELVAVEGIFAVKCLATVSMFWISFTLVIAMN